MVWGYWFVTALLVNTTISFKNFYVTLYIIYMLYKIYNKIINHFILYACSIKFYITSWKLMMYIFWKTTKNTRHISEPTKLANCNYTLKMYILKDNQEYMRHISEPIKMANFNYTLNYALWFLESLFIYKSKSDFLKKSVKYKLKEKKAMKSRN